MSQSPPSTVEPTLIGDMERSSRASPSQDRWLPVEDRKSSPFIGGWGDASNKESLPEAEIGSSEISATVAGDMHDHPAPSTSETDSKWGEKNMTKGPLSPLPVPEPWHNVDRQFWNPTLDEGFEHDRARRDALVCAGIERLTELANWVHEVGNVDLMILAKRPEEIKTRTWLSRSLVQDHYYENSIDIIRKQWDYIGTGRRLIFASRFQNRTPPLHPPFSVENLPLEVRRLWLDVSESMAPLPAFQPELPEKIRNFLTQVDSPEDAFEAVEIVFWQWRQDGAYPSDIPGLMQQLGMQGRTAIQFEILMRRQAHIMNSSLS
ncbi:hypothetical protein M422DRAFT_257352 [Sphaerobolus stellatus SS14]|uniref:Uncharacterized protein n=1 Tax=Sphaerobolus stellatus (strain SS14) TaxID=990650 RepID=A0A0C9UXY3_SPHS4|nr:hypothetical protein M422DRAFT_257352 [Sphaerobolus stellatus SS14]